ncbi:MAG: hypothetical protein VKM98_04875 [Cyanobacteriota bacterium]|nr:hypothetical protein [Cyanobacteriota bacterium]
MAVLLWLFGRRRLQLGTGQQPATAPAPAPLTRVMVGAASNTAAPLPPARGRGAAPRAQGLAALRGAMEGSPAQRLAVMQHLAQHPDRRALPLLKRGLRDADPAVVLAAVAALEPFRGRTPAAVAACAPSKPLRRLPRNAAPLSPR